MLIWHYTIIATTRNITGDKQQAAAVTHLDNAIISHLKTITTNNYLFLQPVISNIHCVAFLLGANGGTRLS